MEPERIELSGKERERLKVLHEVEQGHLKQVEAARRLRLTDRQVRRLQRRLRTQGDGGIVHGLRCRRVKAGHVWRPRRAAFGELVMMDSSPYRWLEDRGPACHKVALIDDASSRVWGRLVEHDSTEENLRTLGGWL